MDDDSSSSSNPPSRIPNWMFNSAMSFMLFGAGLNLVVRDFVLAKVILLTVIALVVFLFAARIHITE